MTDFRPRRFQVLPPIVKNLVIINAIMVGLQLVLWTTFKINLQDYLGLHYWRGDLFRPWQFVTHIFMHGSPTDLQGTIFHIFSNMFGLWMFGSLLEQMWGPKRFLLFYLLCGVGAALCFMGTQAIQYEPLYKSFLAFKASPTLDHYQQFLNTNGYRDIALLSGWQTDPGNVHFPVIAIGKIAHVLTATFNDPMVGASGAVFGVIFAFGYMFPNTEFQLIFPPIPIKAKWIVTIYAVFELYAAWQNKPDDNVAHFAHLGGMLVAFIILKIWQQGRQRFY